MKTSELKELTDEELRQRPIELAVENIVSDFRSAGFEAVGETTFLELINRLEEPPASA